MQVYAAQYGVSAVRPGSPLLASNDGMHTLPSSWHVDLSAHPDKFGHRLPMPPQSAGRTQAGGAEVMTGPVLVVVPPPPVVSWLPLAPPLPELLTLPPLDGWPPEPPPDDLLLQPAANATTNPVTANTRTIDQPPC